ncbi:acyl carrier protein [Saccharothrix saharensis]|uniref:acyl carrier protein n=1 Tax=Saccharothrix saharensis TaxID=571190 RepID=UPI00369787B1
MNSVDDLCQLIQSILADTSAPVDVHVEPETALLVSGLLDSLTIMRISTRIEEVAGVDFPESEVVAANFRTPQALWEVVKALRAEKSAVSR